MRVVFEHNALETMYEVADFINTINLPGAGENWATQLINKVKDFAKPHVKYATCHHQILAGLGYSCIIINGWVIAFKIEHDIFHVYQIIRGNLLD